MPRTKGEIQGLPLEEEGLVDAREMARLIRAACLMAQPPLGDMGALATAMTKAGRPTVRKRCYDFAPMTGPPRSVPSVAELFLIAAITRPPGGLAHFGPAFPALWPLLEADLARTPRIRDFQAEPVRAFFLACEQCGKRSPVMENVRHPGPRLDSMLREWAETHRQEAHPREGGKE